LELIFDDIVAVCPEQEEKPYSLNKRDVLVYTLNRSAFHKSICSGLGIKKLPQQGFTHHCPPNLL
jgi:hypothetical protein